MPATISNIVLNTTAAIDTGDNSGTWFAPVAAPALTHDASEVLSIYSKTYGNLAGTDFNPGWGQATIMEDTDTGLTYRGLNYQGTTFDSQDVSGYEYVHVDFYVEIRMT